MSTEIPVSFAQQYKESFILLSQQRGSKLRGGVRTDPDFLKGKAGYFDRIGSTAMQRRTSRHQDTPLISTPHSRRRVTMEDWIWADLIDAAIYASMGGNAYSMDEDDAASTVALPAGQKVAVNNHAFDSGSGDVGLTVGKLIAAKKVLWANNVDVDNEQLFLLANGHQLGKMLAETEVQSRDYNDVYALVQGQVNQFMGFNIVHYESVSTDASSDELVYAWAMSGVGLAMGMEPTVRVSERADKNYSTQVHVEQSMGATRIEDEKVVEIACDPS